MIISKVSILPEYPNDCSVKEKSFVIEKQRLDIALIKTDRALSRANDRILRCSTWYKKIKESRNYAR